MKQRLILFSALLILSLLIGVASAAEDELLINVTHNGTDNSFIPGDVVKITADFNRSVDQATLSVNNTMSTFEDNESMTPNGTDGKSFEYDFEIPYGIVAGPLDLNISAFNNSSIVGSKIVDSAFVFDPTKYLNTSVQLNRTSYRPGDVVNITANFSQPVDHANISIANNTNSNLPKASLVGADLVTDFPMTEIGDNTFAYNYLIPAGTSSPLDIDISAFDNLGNLLSQESYPSEIGISGPITIVSPTSEFANQSCVTFNFTAYDYAVYNQTGDIVYTFWLDGVQVNNGVITAGAYKQLQFNLADGKHTWEVQTKDSMGEHTTGTCTLYVDTKCPSVTLTSPQDCFKQVIGDTQFNFTCEDALAAQYSDLGLTYTLYVDGKVAQRYGNIGLGNNITGTAKSGTPVTQQVQLDDGAHNWSVSVLDGAGNSVTSEVRKFYVDLNGLTVSSVSPNGGFVSANPTFNFTVKGLNGKGTGLPFNYKLLVDGKEVMKSNCDGNCNGEYNGNDGEDDCNVCVRCSEDGEGDCFVVGSNYYNLKAAVSDGVNKNWTIVVTDITTGKDYQTDLKSFSVDSVAPAAVEHLYSQDKPGNTSWTYLTNSPGLDVYWLPNNETDLATKPYEVYISTSKPSCIEDMELVNTTYLPIDEILKCGGEPLVYGKDYWVAVIARDNASNYNKNFSVYGPVQTYEDMEITLNEGWNLKSVPKRVVDDCPESVFGANSTVLYWDGSCWQFPDAIEPCKGYWVYTNEPCTINVKLKGMSSDSCNPDVPPSLTLTPGWHMIGHTATYAADWPTTLSSLGESFLGVPSSFKFSNLITYDLNEGWGGIISDNYGLLSGSSQVTGQYIYGNSSMPVGALQSDQCMVPGQGYWIFMKDEGIYGSIENVNLTSQDTNTGNGTNTEIPNVPMP